MNKNRNQDTAYNSPQAQNDSYAYSEDIFFNESSINIITFDVMRNDSGGISKSLYSVDSGSDGYEGLLQSDTKHLDEQPDYDSESSDLSQNGAHIWITVNEYGEEVVAYDISPIENEVNGLAAGEEWTDSFVYAIQLGNGTLSWAEITITVTGTNDAPTLAAGVGVAVEDGPSIDVDLAVLGDDIDSDDDGTTLSYTITTDPSEGTATITGTTLTFDPGADFQDLAEGETRQVVIGVTATDSHGATATNDVTITVT
ncbi:Ig-like domain-containing protein, partial [Halomonas alkalisoli]|uniref:Ig-like domain-containing protein n=1 Tax=Halomonas alkalisoli TaxID=2907158 RepID=UPI001F249C19